MNDDIVELKSIIFMNILTDIMSGMTRKQACEKRDINTSTFDRWLAANKEVKDNFVASIKGQINERYAAVQTTRGLVIDRLVEKIRKRIEQDEVSIEELVAFVTDLNKIGDGMEFQLGVLKSDDPGASIGEAMLVTGPILKPAQHKITKTTVTMEFASQDNSDVVEGQILD